ncbi:MAG: phosphotransferase, partial [Bacteroidales bacterium]|nr:phosphotransferase [Bacteroidales bacterium]
MNTDYATMNQEPITKIRSLLQSMGRTEPCTLTPLPPSGSDRKYYHIVFDDASLPDLMAFYNPIVEENRAQVEFTSHFRKLGMKVPDMLAKDDSETVFIVEYLGNQSLFDLASKGITDEVIGYYQQALTDLVHFQIDGVKQLNMEVAYPVANFDRQSILWDLNYFKYCFLKPAGIAFNERVLEADFELFTDELSRSEPDFFCYRDFQARNIMIHQNKPWYIDFQGGRRGPLPYDVVSLLHQVKANLPEELRDSLYQYYLAELESVAPEEVANVQRYYNDFVYFRLMQVLGAYGFRGLVERKVHFLQSIPYAASALSLRLKQHPLLINLPEIKQVLEQIIQKFPPIDLSENENLTVKIYSFSYKKKGIPV